MTDDRQRGTSTHLSNYLFLSDIIIVLVLTSLALGFVFLPELRETPFRFAFGILFVGFLPGYAVITALFPERNGSEINRATERPDEVSTQTTPHLRSTNRSLDGLERVVVSVGLSSVIVVLFGLLLNYTTLGIRLAPMAILLTITTVSMSVVGAIRRWQLDTTDRFYVPFGAWINGLYTELAEPNSKLDSLLNVVIVVAIVITLSSLTYAAAVPHDGEQYTELYLLTENGSEPMAENYPQELVSGEDHSLVVGIDNHELETVNYSVVVELQRVETDDNETSVVERQEIERLETTLTNDERGRYDLELNPDLAGDDLRIAVMLYSGEVPDEPTLDDAYRSVHLWVDVVGQENEGRTAGDDA